MTIYGINLLFSALSAENMVAKLSGVTCEKCGVSSLRDIVNYYHQTLCSNHSGLDVRQEYFIRS